MPDAVSLSRNPGRVRGNVHEEKGLKEKVILSIPYDVDGYLRDFTESGVEEM